MGALTDRRVGQWHVVFEHEFPQHVLCFGHDGRGWIVVDPHWGGAQVFTLADGDEFDAWVREIAALGDVFRMPDGYRASHGWRGLFCVGVVKRLIGLRSGALSPHGLRRDLLKAGARQVFTREGQSPQGRSPSQARA